MRYEPEARSGWQPHVRHKCWSRLAIARIEYWRQLWRQRFHAAFSHASSPTVCRCLCQWQVKQWGHLLKLTKSCPNEVGRIGPWISSRARVSSVGSVTGRLHVAKIRLCRKDIMTHYWHRSHNTGSNTVRCQQKRMYAYKRARVRLLTDALTNEQSMTVSRDPKRSPVYACISWS